MPAIGAQAWKVRRGGSAAPAHSIGIAETNPLQAAEVEARTVRKRAGVSSRRRDKSAKRLSDIARHAVVGDSMDSRVSPGCGDQLDVSIRTRRCPVCGTMDSISG